MKVMAKRDARSRAAAHNILDFLSENSSLVQVGARRAPARSGGLRPLDTLVWWVVRAGTGDASRSPSCQVVGCHMLLSPRLPVRRLNGAQDNPEVMPPRLRPYLGTARRPSIDSLRGEHDAPQAWLTRVGPRRPCRSRSRSRQVSRPGTPSAEASSCVDALMHSRIANAKSRWLLNL